MIPTLFVSIWMTLRRNQTDMLGGQAQVKREVRFLTGHCDIQKHDERRVPTCGDNTLLQEEDEEQSISLTFQMVSDDF